MADVRLNIVSTFKEAGTKAATGALTGLKNFAGGPVGAALAGVGAAAAAGLAAATVEIVNFTDQANAGMRDFAARTGISADELESYRQVALDVFSGPPPLGDSIEDVALAMADVERTTDLAGDALQDATRDALTLTTRFDQDLNEVLRTADSLVKNNLAPDFDAAFDIIATGFQEGLDKSGDFLDTINEYSQDFGSLGFTAKDTLNLINNGLEAGIFNSDKIGDALNEAFINLQDPAVVEKLGEIDGGLGNIADRFNSGQISGKEAFDEIIAGLSAIEDPLARNEAGVQIFRSIWEDLGSTAIFALGGTKDEIDNVAGATERAADSGETLQSRWESAMRGLLVAAEPIGQELAPIIGDALDQVVGFVQEAQPVFEGFASVLGEQIAANGPRIAESFERIAQSLGIVSDGAEGMEAALQATEAFFDTLAGGIDAVTQIVEGLAWMVENVPGLVSPFAQLVDLWKQASELDNAVADFLGIGGSGDGGFLPGFQHGGEMTVGGSGGIDSSIVAFRATPGETVTVTPQGQDIGNITGPNAGRIGKAVRDKVNSMFAQFESDLVAELTR